MTTTLRWLRRAIACVSVVLLLQTAIYLWVLSYNHPGVNNDQQIPEHPAVFNRKVTTKWLILKQGEESPLSECRFEPALAVVQPDLGRLQSHLLKDRHFSWILRRIQTTWGEWVEGAREARLQRNRRSKQRVLVVPGVLMATDFANQANSSAGGPLGDLMQWADLLAALHVLGHNVTVMSDIYQAIRGLIYGGIFSPPHHNCNPFNVIYVDIIFLKSIPYHMFNRLKCRFRILDAYGTEAMYNNNQYATAHDLFSPYGGFDLHLKQFFTFYPHTPDNSFLGFMVEKPKVLQRTVKEDIGLLYGKNMEYFKGHSAYMKQLSSHMRLHTTVLNASGLPDFVTNHGILTSENYSLLLGRSKYLIGLGQPLESTGALEGVANGCIFFNPKFRGQQQMILQNMNKPTTRAMSSQIPYLEELVGEPRVFTLDISDPSDIRQTLQRASKVQQTDGFLPPEFSAAGFLERLNFYLIEQDFCRQASGAASVSQHARQALEVHLGPNNASCLTVCQGNAINSPEALQRANGLPGDTTYQEEVFLPAVDDLAGIGVFQKNYSLFSCAGANHRLRRVCPCRRRNPSQTALCLHCV